MHLGRSFLFVPANRRKMLDKIPSLPADAFILDLEDAVPLPEKENARAMVRDYAGIPGQRIWVRTNSPQSGLIEDDIRQTLSAPGLAGYFVPKVDTVGQMQELDRLLTHIEKELSLSPGSTKVVLTNESACAVWLTYDLAKASTRVASVVFGGARDGDLMNDLGCSWSAEGPELIHARQHTLLGARAAGIRCPLDGVYADIRDSEGFEKDTELSRRLGYRGRAVIHPSQIEPANRLYTTPAAELEYYSRVLEAFEAAVARGQATTTVDGRMIDEAMAAAARRSLEQASSQIPRG